MWIKYRFQLVKILCTKLPLAQKNYSRVYYVDSIERALSVKMTMESKQDDITILQQAEKRLRRLSPERLRVVSDFLAALEEKEEHEATAELLNVPGFEQALREAMQEAEAGEVVSFDSIRRHV